MPFPLDLVDLEVPPVEHAVDSRWLMAYAASVGAMGPSYVDTTRPDGIVAHPLFTVGLEWPAVLAMRDRFERAGLRRDEAARAVHLTHDLALARPIVARDRLRTTARVASIRPHRSGTLVDLELVTIDEAGTPVVVTTMGTLYRGVDRAGARDDDPSPGRPADPDPSPSPSPDLVVPIEVPANAAHVYTECSRIWNPIHTDARSAAKAGLPGIILHGTASLAMAVSSLVTRLAADDPRAVRAISCRFAAMVTLPSTLELRAWTGPPGAPVAFAVLGPGGAPVVRDGRVTLGDPLP